MRRGITGSLSPTIAASGRRDDCPSAGLKEVGLVAPKALVTHFRSIARLKGGHRRRNHQLFLVSAWPRPRPSTTHCDLTHRGPRDDEHARRRESFGRRRSRRLGKLAVWAGAARRLKCAGRPGLVWGRQSAAQLTPHGGLRAGRITDHPAGGGGAGCAIARIHRRPQTRSARAGHACHHRVCLWRRP